MKFYGQRNAEHADCLPRALANAAVLLGADHPKPDTSAWYPIIVAAGCLHGAALLGVDELAPYFGLAAKRIDAEAIRGVAPLILDVMNPCVGTSLHCVLITRWYGPAARVVNYRTDAARVVERLPISYEAPPQSRTPPWTSLYIPERPNDRAWQIARKESA